MTTERETVMSSYPNANRVHQVTRVIPSEKLLETSVLRIEQKITTELERELKSIQENTQHLANAVAPIRRLIEQDHRAVASLDALHKLAREEQQRRVEVFKQGTAPELMKTFSFTANPGFNILVPPYDVEWSTGASWVADKASGKLGCLILDGFTAAAVGVFLSSPVKSLVRFSPVAPFSYDWMHWPSRGPTSSRGGVGVLAYSYDNEDKRPLLQDDALLWNDSRDFPAPIAHDSGGSFVSAVLPRDVLITMEPGSTYLVWVWCWGMAHSSTTQGHEGVCIAQITCTVPLIVVDAGPAPHLA